MSKDKHRGGNSDRNDHDDHGSGHKGKLQLLVGTSGDDVLVGSNGNDLIIGRAGDDQLLGGAGNDILIGDGGSGGKHWGWNHCHWWKPKGQDDDYLDGGAGSDLILAGKGDDVANYTLSENTGAHDVYDGGKGFDTLQLTVTWAELHLDSVQKDIAAFEAFLDRKANPKSDDGKTFHFQSFDLDARNFEALEIVLLNAPPVAQNDAYALDEDTALVVLGPGILGNDSDLEGSPLSVALVAGPAHGTLALGADGSFSYTPNANFNGGDSFTYKVNDGDLDSNVATVLLTIAPVNDAPVAGNDAATTDEDTPVVINVLANDTDVDGDTLSPVVVQAPTHGTLGLNADGSLTYTPHLNFNGTDSFTYAASDGALASDVAVVGLTIAAVNDAPSASDDSLTIDEDVSVTGNVLVNDTDVDGDALSAVLVDGPAHGTLALSADGTFTYTPNANFNGTDGFTYRASDGSLQSGFASVALTVAPVNDAPVAEDDSIGGTPGGGPIRVAVIGGASSTYAAAAAQLNDEASGAFDLDATAILATAFATEGEWAAALASYDVVVLGGSGGGNDYGDSPLFAALGDFVDAGGGVVTTGWFAQAMAGMSGTTLSDADYITPITGSQYAYAANLSTITIADAAHSIAGGTASYTVQALLHELAQAIDGSATPLATGTATSGDTLTAIAYDEVGLGQTAYVGSLHFAGAAYAPEFTRGPDMAHGADVDMIFEQAVAWAASEPDSGAATNEDTVLVIDDAALLANDTDIEDDALSLISVAATSTLGAALSIDADGNVVYDPTTGLQYLDAGEIVTDSFEYTVGDGHGGFDTATVSLTVEGVNDEPDAVNDSASTNEDTAFSGNVLGNDSDPDGNALSVIAATLTSTKGASVSIGANGIFTYNPAGSAELQALGAGASTLDSFNYTLSDGKGATDTATVNITVAGLAEGGTGSGSFSGPPVAANVNFKDLSPVVFSGPGVDLYIQFEGLSNDWLRLGSFSMSMERPFDAGSGQITGSLNVKDVLATLGSGEVVVQLTKELFAGNDLDGVQIGAYAPDKTGQLRLFEAFSFDEVHLTGLDTSGSAGGTANALSIDFAGFTHKSTEFGGSKTVEGTWDFGESGAGDAATAPLTAPTKNLGDVLETDDVLQYYVRFDGDGFANDWLTLGSFSMGLHAPQSGGMQSGPVQSEPLNLLLGANPGIVALTDALADASAIDSVEIEAYTTSTKTGARQLVDQYYFEDLQVTGLQSTDGTANAAQFTYAAFSHGHVDQLGGGVTQFGWEFDSFFV
jgi:VCBS repeat-containing protein